MTLPQLLLMLAFAAFMGAGIESFCDEKNAGVCVFGILLFVILIVCLTLGISTPGGFF